VLFRLLRTFLRRYRRELGLVLLLQAVQAMASLYLPNLSADIIDQGVLTQDTGYITSTGAFMLAVSLVQVICAVAAVYYGSKVAMAFGRDVRNGLFDQVTSFSSQEVEHLTAPSLITRVTNDVQQVQMFVLMTCTLLIAAPITMIGGIVMALRQNVALSWILTVSIPVLVLAIGLVVSRMVPQFRLMQLRIDDVNQVLREQITGLRVVRAFVREPAERRRFGVVNDSLTETSLNAGRLMAMMFPIVTFVLNASSVAVIWFGAAQINAGSMAPGSLIAYLTYLIQILMAVMMATFMVVMAPRAAVCAERINEVLDTVPEIHAPDVPESPLPAVRGLVELRGVGFRYPGAEAPVLTDIDLLACPGETTAIIGSTGAGKTTLLNLIPRLYDVTAGSVLVDGVDVRDHDPEALWSRIGLVPQKAYLFGGTVASNLRFGNVGASDEDLWQALEVAQAADFVREMSGGLDAPVAQGGTNFSGGQRQRLAIARALARKPEIYLFDDAFSALDTATDARLRSALQSKVADATVVIVAQRVSTIISADRILVIEDGHEIGVGTHEELLAACPTYQEIVASQLGTEDAA